MAESMISIVVPLYQEEDNVPLLVAEVADKLSDFDYELILVDDGSDDGTVAAIKKAREMDKRVVLVQLRRNFGQTAAMSAGFERIRGQYVVYMDGDLQTDPADIPLLLERLKRDGLDMVNGWRKDRQDASLSRNIPSKLANLLIRTTTKVHMHDYGCPMKLMRADVAKNFRIYGEQHRFLPVLANLYGAKIGEEVVNHRPRQFGKSKYGIGRTIRVLVDLLLIVFFQRFTDRPLQLFGPVGLISLLTGLFIDVWLSIDKLLFGAELAGRPMLQLGSMMIVTGILLFGIGLILEMQTRIYYESTNRHHYKVREEDE
ncbi:MAG: glycosyltransferase family 2 protein [Mariprofundaceae bacterium]